VTPPLTQVSRIDPDELAYLRGLVARLIPTLDWRHNGLGLMQAYVHEGVRRELRVHVWDRSLHRPGIERSGLLHDHRFDLRSTLLLGDLVNVEYHLTPDPDGPYALHSVVPARKAFAMSGQHDGLVRDLGDRVSVTTREVPLCAGDRYFFPKLQFHGTLAHNLTVTLVEKLNQTDDLARILAPRDEPVVHAFANPYSKDRTQPVLDQAQRLLLKLSGYER